MRVFTLGYERLAPELYVSTLVDHGVGLVIDVREYAWSHRPAFVKTVLERNLAAAGIGYVHCKAAGNPKAVRKAAKQPAEWIPQYRQYLSEHVSAVREVLELIGEANSEDRYACLTCYERDAANCHRSVLIEELTKLEPQLSAVHLPRVVI